MKFAVQVDGSPFGSEAGDSAYQFIRAAIGRGHQLSCVFFYHDGAHQGAASMHPPDDETNPAARWSSLAQESGVDLVVCVSAARRRGVVAFVDETFAEDPGDFLAPGFRLGGLGFWVDACMKSDRVLVFRG